MDRIDAMRAFTRIVSRGSFARVAEELGLPPSTLTDAIRKLEARLGTRLLHRTTRSLSLTADGAAYHQRCLAILAEIDDIEDSLNGAEPRGTLRVEAQASQVQRVILPGLADFLEAHPGIDIVLSDGDRYVDAFREGIDCVLRVGHPGDQRLVARPIAELAEATVASPAYIARHGMPQAWDRLAGHQMVAFHSSATGRALPLEFMVEGQRREVTLPARLTVTGAGTYGRAALAGLGLAQVPRYAVADDIAAGRLVEILPETPPSSTTVYLAWPPALNASRRLRLFRDWLAQRYAEAPFAQG